MGEGSAHNQTITRREALKGSAATIGATALLSVPLAFAEEPPIQVAGRAVEVSLTSVSPQTVRLTIQSIENGSVQPIPSDGALVKEDYGKPNLRLRSLRESKSVKCGELTAHLTANPFTVKLEAKGGRVVQELKTDPASPNLNFILGTGPIFGLGQGGPQFNRGGNKDRMVSGQGGYRLHTNGAKVPIQLAIGTSGWAMFVHSPLGAFDLTGTEGVVEPTKPEAALPMDVFIIGATDPASVMGEYAKITGYPEMAPLWSFGYQQSHRTLGTPEEIMQEAKTFREKKLPCDAMIYLGTDFCPNGWNTHNGEFVWNPKAFPEPEKAIQKLHDEHFKVALHIVIE